MDVAGNALRTRPAPELLTRPQVEELMPQHPNFVFVDSVIEIVARKSIRTSFYVDPDSLFIQWHFPEGPSLLPGVILIEFASQSAYLFGRLTRDGPADGETHVLAKCSATFKSPATPGDTLIADVAFTDEVGDVSVYDATIHTGEREVARVRLYGAKVRDPAVLSGNGRANPS